MAGPIMTSNHPKFLWPGVKGFGVVLTTIIRRSTLICLTSKPRTRRMRSSSRSRASVLRR